MKKKSVPEVLFRYDKDFEHMIIWSENGALLDDSLEGFPKISAIEVLRKLADNGIISLEVEEVKCCFCETFDFSTVEIRVDEEQSKIHILGGNTKANDGNRFLYCPECGRELK